MKRVYYYFDEIPGVCRDLLNRINQELKKMNLENETSVYARVTNNCSEPHKCRMVEIPVKDVKFCGVKEVDQNRKKILSACKEEFITSVAEQMYEDSGKKNSVEMRISVAGTDKCPVSGKNGLLLYWNVLK